MSAGASLHHCCEGVASCVGAEYGKAARAVDCLRIALVQRALT